MGPAVGRQDPRKDSRTGGDVMMRVCVPTSAHLPLAGRSKSRRRDSGGVISGGGLGHSRACPHPKFAPPATNVGSQISTSPQGGGGFKLCDYTEHSP